jgi:EF hand
MLSPIASRQGAWLAGALSATSSSRPRSTGDKPFPVAEAQAESARAAQAKTAAEARNADGIRHFASKGLTMSYGSYTALYKADLAKVVDINDDQTISRQELADQVHRGGALRSAAEELYAAMDMNRDGSLSIEEFKSSIPDPFATPGFKDQLNRLTASGAADPISIGALYRRHGGMMDAATVLETLARHISTSA